MTVIADKLAPYRYPRLASIHTSGEKRGVLDRVGVTEREVYEEVMAEMIAKIRVSGELPRAVKAYIERHSNGGVANRNAV